MTCCRYCIPPKRYPGCHDHCPERAAELAANAERKAEAEKKRAIAHSIYKQKSDGVYRAFRKNGRHKKKGSGYK